MDKNKIGNFFKQLRLEKGLSQEQFVEDFSSFLRVNCDAVSIATVSKWERGESFPDIVNVQYLALYYDITIDEIFNGEKATNENFEKKYIIAQDDWFMQYDTKQTNLYELRNQQELKVEKAFLMLLSGLVNNTLTTSEEREFDFIVSHFYNIKNGMGIDEVKFHIRKQSALMHKSTFNEKYWEAYKYFNYCYKLRFYYDICDAVLPNTSIMIERIKNTYDVEKDILLAFIQKNSFYDTHGAMSNEQFERVYGIQYDIEKLTKDMIRVLIQNGACLNDSLLGHMEIWKINRSIVNALEYVYEQYKKPILISVFENGKNEYYLVENTEKNRKLAGMKDVEYTAMQIGIDELERRLLNGEEFFTEEGLHWVGIEDIKSEEFKGEEKEVLQNGLRHIRDIIEEKSYEDYYKGRKIKETQDLLRDLDVLTLSQIRKKYFTLENTICE